ncbi:MAG: hydroxymethylbilane synthase [Planctomycetaceae bacterium]
MKRIVLGSRGSALARAQTGIVAELLRARGMEVVLEILATRGDRETALPVGALGGKGLFTAELEEAILAGRIDAAVHSLKDLPTQATRGLLVAAVPRRAEWRDALVSRHGGGLADLRPGATVGTSSVRRQALLRHARKDLRVVELRGNVDTRLQRVAAGEIDAAVVAAAGLLRLGRDDAITSLLDFLPAPAQGALALQADADRKDVLEAVRPLHDAGTDECVQAERTLLAALEGGCTVPVGALAVQEGTRLLLRGLVAAPDGSRVLFAEARGEDPHEVGWDVAHRLRRQGADEILRA